MVRLRRLWDWAGRLWHALVCAVFKHRPVKVIDKATVVSVAIIDHGAGVGLGARVDGSHVACQRCGARQNRTADGRLVWVR